MSDKIDPNSPTWLVVKAHAEAEIEKARGRLEMPGSPQSESDIERGRIKALRELLALSVERKPVEFGTGPINY